MTFGFGRLCIAAGALGAMSVAGFAHHDWGTYDAANPITVVGPIAAVKYENPHATIAVRSRDKLWTVTLAPTSLMENRGATREVVAIGKTVTIHGYVSTVDKDEMRAERISIDGKTYELR